MDRKEAAAPMDWTEAAAPVASRGSEQGIIACVTVDPRGAEVCSRIGFKKLNIDTLPLNTEQTQIVKLVATLDKNAQLATYIKNFDDCAIEGLYLDVVNYLENNLTAGVVLVIKVRADLKNTIRVVMARGATNPY